MKNTKKSNLYEEVFPIWDKKNTKEQKLKVEIVSKDHERLVLYFPTSKQTVSLGKLNGGAYMPMSGGIYQVEDKIIAVTFEEHSAGATHHNFELHFLDFEGTILLTPPLETAHFLVRSATHLFFLVYLERYIRKNHYCPILELHSFEINSLRHTKTLIEPPNSLRPFYTNEYINFISTTWKILPNQVSITCVPWQNVAKNKEEKIPSLNFEYVF